MTQVLVLYYSMYGHIERLADAIAEGARSIATTHVDVRRVPDLVPHEVLVKAGAKIDQPAPIAMVDDLPKYDAIIVGTPTRFGNMCAQMRNFFDQTGPLWAKGALIGKVGSVFTSTGTGHGGETTIVATHFTMLHHGMVIVGVPFSVTELTDLSEVRAGGTYGAATIAGSRRERSPTEKELAIARQQGQHVARIAAKLAA